MTIGTQRRPNRAKQRIAQLEGLLEQALRARNEALTQLAQKKRMRRGDDEAAKAHSVTRVVSAGFRVSAMPSRFPVGVSIKDDSVCVVYRRVVQIEDYLSNQFVSFDVVEFGEPMQSRDVLGAVGHHAICVQRMIEAATPLVAALRHEAELNEQRVLAARSRGQAKEGKRR